MKNLFNKLVAVLLMAAATMGMSCSECEHVPYDDSEIKQQIADLYSKLAQLEANLNGEIAKLQNLLNGKAMITKVTTDAAGNTVIELSDGNKITVYAEYKPEQLPTNLVYVIEQDGVLVWATMDSNGQLSPILDADGKVIPVSQAIPSIQFRENNGMIEISIDGGANWTATGVTAEAMQDAIADATASCSLIKSVEEVDGQIVITLQSGDTFVVAKAVESNFGIKSGKLYFGASETKVIELVAEGIEDVSVLEKPEAWKAKVNGTKLTITAPAADLLTDADYDGVADSGADIDGYIKLHATSASGQCIIGKILVSASEDRLTVKTTLMNEIIVENYVPQTYFALGMMPAAQFDAKAVAEAVKAGSTEVKFQNYDWYYNYETTTLQAEEVYQQLYGAELPQEKFVVWVLPYTEELDYSTYEYVPVYLDAEQMVYTDFTPMSISIESTTTFCSINLKVNVDGCSALRTTIVEKQYAAQLEDNFAYSQRGESWALSSLGQSVTVPYSFEGPATSYPNDGIEIKPATTYVVWVWPMSDDKAPADYNYATDVIQYEVTTDALQAGGSATVAAADVEADYTTISATLNATDAMLIYWNIFKKADMPATNDEVATKLLENGFLSTEKATMVYMQNLNAGTEYVIAAVGVDSEGKYGVALQHEVTTTAVVYNSPVTVTIDEANSVINSKELELKWNATGGNVKQYLYFMNETSNYTYINSMGGTVESAADYMVINKTMYSVKKTTDTTLKQTVYNKNERVLIVIAEDENGEYSVAASWIFTPNY